MGRPARRRQEAMTETRRWINQGQPQTMQIAVFLLYANAVFTAILGSDSDGFIFLGLVKVGLSPSNLLEQLCTIGLAAGYAIGGYLTANERKWGYRTAIVASALPLAGVLLLLVLPSMNGIPRFTLGDFSLVSLLFDVALFALLVHPQSRDYERIWFK